MPTANSTARNMMDLPNSAPTNTISPEKTASNKNVLNRFACGCQVIGPPTQTTDNSNLGSRSLNQRTGGRVWFQSAVSVDRVVDQVGQRKAAWHVRQFGQLVAGLRGVVGDGFLRSHDSP